MKLTTKEFVEIMGTVAIVASLVFVGMQLRQDRNIALAQVYSARSEARQAALQSLLESDVALQELVKSRALGFYNVEFSIPDSWIDPDDPKITEARRIRNEMIIMATDNNVYQSSLGLFEVEPISASMKALFRADKGLREFAVRTPYISSVTRNLFQEIVDELEAEGL